MRQHGIGLGLEALVPRMEGCRKWVVRSLLVSSRGYGLFYIGVKRDYIRLIVSYSLFRTTTQAK